MENKDLSIEKRGENLTERFDTDILPNQPNSNLSHRHIIISFSSSIFGGFTTKIDTDHVATSDDIIAIAVSSLFEILERYNFRELLQIARKSEFHIHEPSLDTRDGVITPLGMDYAISKGIWICDHK